MAILSRFVCPAPLLLWGAGGRTFSEMAINKGDIMGILEDIFIVVLVCAIYWYFLTVGNPDHREKQ